MSALWCYGAGTAPTSLVHSCTRQVVQGMRVCGNLEGRGKCGLHLGDMKFRGARGETMVGRILRGPRILGPGVHTPLALLSHILL